MLVLLMMLPLVLGAQQPADRVTAEFHGAETSCSILISEDGAQKALALTRMSGAGYTLKVIEAPAQSEAALSRRVLTLGAERRLFRAAGVGGSRVAEFSGSNSAVELLARTGVLNLVYEGADATEPEVVTVTLPPDAREAWAGCIMTLGSIDRYDH